jgi:uncharacterized protein with ATP-grasp and redox domains
MQSDLKCIPCIFRQVLAAAERVKAPEDRKLAAFNEAARLVPRLDMRQPPSVNSHVVLKAANRVLRCADPYYREKRHYNALALKLLPRLRRLAEQSSDPLRAALKIAAAGNVIDLGINPVFDVEKTIGEVMRDGFARDHFKAFQRELARAREILYLLDNAGEVVFDMVLLERLGGRAVTAVVNSRPIINDATLEDARQVGLGKLVRVMASGSDTIGKLPAAGSATFQRAFRKADLIIAKGHGNYENLEDAKANIFFLLRAKCDVVAASLGVKMGQTVFVRKR